MQTWLCDGMFEPNKIVWEHNDIEQFIQFYGDFYSI